MPLALSAVCAHGSARCAKKTALPLVARDLAPPSRLATSPPTEGRPSPYPHPLRCIVRVRGPLFASPSAPVDTVASRPEGSYAPPRPRQRHDAGCGAEGARACDGRQGLPRPTTFPVDRAGGHRGCSVPRTSAIRLGGASYRLPGSTAPNTDFAVTPRLLRLPTAPNFATKQANVVCHG